MSHLRSYLPMLPRLFRKASYAQEGEDVLLSRIFDGQRRGFYVDVGAHHPFRFSNTYWAYRRGWRGINIDADPKAIRLLKSRRPGDTNVQCLAGQPAASTDFFVFAEGALNTSVPKRRDFIKAQTGLVPNLIQMKVRSLASLLDEYLPAGIHTIDFLSIDVEGAEMGVLAGNNWTRYRPRVVVVELAGVNLETVSQAPESVFLTERDYTPVSLLYHSVFFIGDEELLKSWKMH